MSATPNALGARQADGYPLRLAYQSRWCREGAALALIVKSRRIGISWADASERVLHAASGRGSVVYMSYNRDMTRTYIDDCASWAARLGQAVGAVREEGSALEPDAMQFRLDFASGKSIIALPSSPRVLRSRGKPGDVVVIDEAAFCDDLDAILKAATAVTMWGGTVRIVSTHNGEASPFNRLAVEIGEGKHPRWGLHQVTLDDAIADGLARRVFSVTGRPWHSEAAAEWRAEVLASYTSEAAMREELFCVPSQGGGAWLSWADIRAATHADAGRPELAGEHGVVYVGIDIARRRDLWVAAAVEVVGDVRWVREIVAARDISFAEQYTLVANMVERYRPVRVAVDQTGMGEAVVERLQETHGTHRVEGVILSGPRRLDVATSLLEVTQDRRLRIPDDEALRADLHSIRAETGPTGGPRLLADRGGTDGHADRFWALALAISAAAVPRGEYGYEPLYRAAGASRQRMRMRPDADDAPRNAPIGYGGIEHGRRRFAGGASAWR